MSKQGIEDDGRLLVKTLDVNSNLDTVYLTYSISSNLFQTAFLYFSGATVNEVAPAGDDMHKVNKRRKFSYVYTTNQKRCIMCKFRN